MTKIADLIAEADLLEKELLMLDPQAKIEDTPEKFLCPISLGVMEEPVMAADGRFYEKSCIETVISQAVARGNTPLSPLSRKPLIPPVVFPGVDLATEIGEYLEEKIKTLKGILEEKQCELGITKKDLKLKEKEKEKAEENSEPNDIEHTHEHAMALGENDPDLERAIQLSLTEMEERERFPHSANMQSVPMSIAPSARPLNEEVALNPSPVNSASSRSSFSNSSSSSSSSSWEVYFWHVNSFDGCFSDYDYKRLLKETSPSIERKAIKEYVFHALYFKAIDEERKKLRQQLNENKPGDNTVQERINIYVYMLGKEREAMVKLEERYQNIEVECEGFINNKQVSQLMLKDVEVDKMMAHRYLRYYRLRLELECYKALIEDHSTGKARLPENQKQLDVINALLLEVVFKKINPMAERYGYVKQYAKIALLEKPMPDINQALDDISQFNTKKSLKRYCDIEQYYDACSHTSNRPVQLYDLVFENSGNCFSSRLRHPYVGETQDSEYFKTPETQIDDVQSIQNELEKTGLDYSLHRGGNGFVKAYRYDNRWISGVQVVLKNLSPRTLFIASRLQHIDRQLKAQRGLDFDEHLREYMSETGPTFNYLTRSEARKPEEFFSISSLSSFFVNSVQEEDEEVTKAKKLAELSNEFMCQLERSPVATEVLMERYALRYPVPQKKRYSSSPAHDTLFKIRIIGDSGVGKSCLLLRMTDDIFTDSFLSTIGVDFKFKNIKLANQDIRLQIWDMPGSDRFAEARNHHFPAVHCAVICFDLTDRRSFQNVQKWLKDVGIWVGGKPVVILVGNKCDLREERNVSREEALALAECHSVPYFETSAKHGIDCERVAAAMGLSVMKNNHRLNYEQAKAEAEEKAKAKAEAEADKSNPEPNQENKSQFSPA